MEEELPILLDIQDNNIIKIVGVGGGGCNAVNFMYTQEVKDVSFLVCNTDTMALEGSHVPAKLQLGPGLGAGGRPEVAQELAAKNIDKIKTALDDGTKMVFITAGMGGGTGTGASPVVAKVAQEMGILTVGIVTIPFAFEGKKAIRKAFRGIAKLAEYTDALLVINNEKLRMLFPDFDLPNAFRSSDSVVSNAAKSIAEIITVPGYINTDFQDVYNTLRNGGVAVMNVGRASGEKRITKAIEDALKSPLVDTTDVHGASRILLNFYCSEEHAILMQELDDITNFCDSMGDEVEIKWGVSYDSELGEDVKVTIIATGYSVNDIPGLDEAVDGEEEAAQPQKPIMRPTIEEAIDKFYDIAPTNADKKEEESEEQTEEPVEDTTEDTSEEEKQTEEVVDIDEPGAEEPAGPAQPLSLDDDVIEIDFDNYDPSEIEDIPAWKRRR